MANHPPELDRSRYRCCCCHVNEGVLIIAILGVMFTSVYNPVSWIAHVLLLVGYATKIHRLYYSYVVLEVISCVLLVLAAILCVVDLVASSQSRVSLGYAWNDDPGGTQTLTLVFLFLFLFALVQQIWSIHVVRRAIEFLDEKEKLKKAKNQGFVATPNVFVAHQPIASYPPSSTSAQPTYAPGYAPPASAPQPGPSTPYPAHDASYPTKYPSAYPRV